MKHIITLIIILSGISLKSQEQENPIVTSTFTVQGNCSDCKKKIENAADIKGVKFFEWDKDTKVAKVVFNSKKTNLETIEKAIAAEGYDTPSQTAPDKAYHKLPECCQYRSGVCKEKK